MTWNKDVRVRYSRVFYKYFMTKYAIEFEQNFSIMQDHYNFNLFYKKMSLFWDSDNKNNRKMKI